MKLLVSDYDGTFNISSNLKAINSNIDSIKRFQNNGNLFAIATGRNYSSIKTQIDKYKIPYDYLVCSDGISTFDSKDNLIHANIIKEDKLLAILSVLNSIPYVTNIDLVDMYGNETQNYNNVCEIYIRIKPLNLLDIKNLKKILSHMQSLSLLNYVRIREDISKVSGIETIKNIKEINKNNIYTIGNEINDFEMLKEYKGHKVLLSNPILRGHNIKYTSSVKSLVKKIERE
jgi:hydroxymethylpyrimidine pyrophosphatase-like HAD family hydrolase